MLNTPLKPKLVVDQASLTILRRGRELLAPTPVTWRNRKVWGWFCLTLLYAAVLAVLTWGKITANPFYLPDDARQHVFWMQQFVDPALFADDWIAEYFRSVAPQGYTWIYQVAARLGIPPLDFNAILPSILIILTAIALFFTCLELCALPAASFAASVLLAQSIEYTSSVASGTPKAFVFLLTLLFWYGWLRRSISLTGVAILLQGLFYPPTVLISFGVLGLGLLERQPEGHWRFTSERQRWRVSSVGGAIAIGIILQYGLSSSEFGPTISLAAALEMPEFYEGGRGNFFRPSVVDYLLYGRSGLQLYNSFTPVTNALALALPFLSVWPQRFPLVTAIRPKLGLWWRVAATTAFWFVASHLLLFKLHLPNRYVGRYWLLLFVVLAGMAIVICIDGLLQASIQLLERRSPTVAHWRDRFWALGSGALALGLAAILVLYPLTYPSYPTTSLARGRAPELYRFLAAQPKDSLLASLSAEANNIPSFSGRSVLVNSEIALPYHVAYYQEIRRRAKDVIQAQYSPDPEILRAVIQRYGITHWLLDTNAFSPSAVQDDEWVQQYQPEANDALLWLETGQVAALAQLTDRCQIFASEAHRVLDAACLVVESERIP